jgi:septal ring factor EnvC (AmiA/AmiB activator)
MQKVIILFILTAFLSNSVSAQSSSSAPTTKDIKKLKKWDSSYEAWEKQMKDLASQKENLEKQLKAYNDALTQMSKNTKDLSSAYGDLETPSSTGSASGTSGDASQLMAATKQMQETQMSFNLQYLQLQSQMQNENRSFTAVSNIMKTKHDTVKNSISNIR